MVSTAGGSAWQKFRGSRGSVVSSALVLIGGVIAGTAGIAAGTSGTDVTHMSAHLGYRCQLPSGTAPVTVLVTGTLPATVTPGERIQPAAVQVTATLPQAITDNLTRTGATSVAAAGTLTAIETAYGKSVAAEWPAGTTTRYALPATGDLRLVLTATAPPLTAASPGTVALTASDLVLNFSPRKADGSAIANQRMTCALTGGTNGGGTNGGGASALLAQVTVAAASPSPSLSPRASSSTGAAPAQVKGIPKGCGKIKVVGFGTATCGYITGYSDVAKLFGAALLQPPRPAKPALVNLDFAESHKIAHNKLVVHSTAKLYFHGRAELPPVTATFLAFRFVPVKATLHLVELAPIKIVSVSGITAPPFPIKVTASTKISIRISRVRVNGVPLDVGTHCQTAHPVKLVLIGRGQNTLPPKGYTVPTGGPLSGKVTIPPFTRCGVSENLDPLLTGSISGSGNFVKMTQGKLCGPSQPANWTCPPPVPKPLR
ncbi:MAG: hypothetical protein LBV34_20625 [Nocardiopsaceae bacterium]|nr:hypothetical protein [Nocardiopsaceae bacterium]